MRFYLHSFVTVQFTKSVNDTFICPAIFVKHKCNF